MRGFPKAKDVEQPLGDRWYKGRSAGIHQGPMGAFSLPLPKVSLFSAPQQALVSLGNHGRNAEQTLAGEIQLKTKFANSEKLPAEDSFIIE